MFASRALLRAASVPRRSLPPLLRTLSSARIDAPTTAAEGMRVEITYTGMLEDGTIFDSNVSDDREPLAFTIGDGLMIPGFEKGVVGMSVGETKEIHMGPEDAYGEWNERALQQFPIEKMPEDTEVGTQLQTAQGGRAVVTKIEDDMVTVDLNHPLAGKDLSFTIELLSCRPAPELVVETLEAGDGKTYPKAGDKLSMHYTGTLAADGSKFDSSVDRGQPFIFTIGVGQVIQGWDQGVIQMSLGEKALLHIPSALGYGSRGAGSAIPPNADLKFEVELLAIN